MRKQEFNSEEAAQAAYDADPASHSIVGYPAGKGYEAKYAVYFDDNAEHETAADSKVLTIAELFAPLARAEEKKQQATAAAFRATVVFDAPRTYGYGYPVLKDGEG